MAGGQGPPPTDSLVGKDGGKLAGDSHDENLPHVSSQQQPSDVQSRRHHGPSKAKACKTNGSSEMRKEEKKGQDSAPPPPPDSSLMRTLSASKLSAFAQEFVPLGGPKPLISATMMLQQQTFPMPPPPVVLTREGGLMPLSTSAGSIAPQMIPLPAGMLPVVPGMYMQAHAQAPAPSSRQARNQPALEQVQVPVSGMPSDPSIEPESHGEPLVPDPGITAAEKEELKAKILKQVEFYFSDKNLPTDNFLLDKMRKNAEGFVPLAIVANFRKVKALTKQKAVVQAALRSSELLVLSDDGKMVRRKEPLVEVDMSEVQGRTVVAENLPDDHSIEAMEHLFGKVGKVKMVRVCHPTAANGANQMANKYPGTDMLVSNKLHALVEYETVAEAEHAVAELTDQNNWRSGLRVRLLVRRSKFQSSKTGYQHAPASKGKKNSAHSATAEGGGGAEGNANHTGDSGVESGGEVDTATGGSEAEGNAPEKEGSGASRRRAIPQSRGRGKGRGRGVGVGSPHSQGFVIGSPSQCGSLGTSPNVGEGMLRLAHAPPPGPKMPDGTRGFTFGRGKKLQEKVEVGVA